MRAAAEGAQLGMPEVQMGIPSVIEGPAARPDRLGADARDAPHGRALFAAESLGMGLVQKVAPAAELDAAVAPWVAAICRASRKRCARRRP